MSKAAVLVLEDGTVFEGRSVGYEGLASGKIVPYAGVSGFPDVMTDPSYLGKMLCFTYPQVGNPGVGAADYQSDRPWTSAAIMREICPIKANRLGEMTFGEFLQQHQIPGIDSIDTRRLTRTLYENGPRFAVLGAGRHADPKKLADHLASLDPNVLPDGEYAVRRAQKWTTPGGDGEEARRYRVVVHDFGVKRGFIRRLGEVGCEVRLVPCDHPAKDSLADDVDGVVFSAGPGDPAGMAKAIKTAEAIIGKKPVWGVGVGAGVVALAAGAKTLVDGRGRYGAQAVGRRDEPSGEMTMQCRDFWIDPDSLAPAKLDMSHFHLNDKTVEGFESDERAIMGVLFHPEAEPGSRDSLYLFNRFAEMLHAKKSKWLGLL